MRKSIISGVVKKGVKKKSAAPKKAKTSSVIVKTASAKSPVKVSCTRAGRMLKSGKSFEVKSKAGAVLGSYTCKGKPTAKKKSTAKKSTAKKSTAKKSSKKPFALANWFNKTF